MPLAYLEAVENKKLYSIVVPGGVLDGEGYESGCYVPVIAEAANEESVVQTETCPILFNEIH